MYFDKSAWTRLGSTTLFVLLWASGAIFTRWGLDHASAFAFLILRFTIAIAALTAFGILFRRQLLPLAGTRRRVAQTGMLLIGGYSICYFSALEAGMTPGVLATVLGTQPILTLVLTERGLQPGRLGGLGLALGGLVLMVYESLVSARLSPAGAAFALGALLCMTFGAILQKGIRQAPTGVLTLQYGLSLAICLALLPVKPFEFELTPGFLIPLLWLGPVISVAAQLLLYRLISTGSLVNVTSLFYLVPVVTALMDYLFLGNRLSQQGLIGMAAILAGLALVFGRKAPAVVSQCTNRPDGG
ncbi:hypothetical protein GCM10011348_46650 [Marinobacterium nitratireducens]|uniref:EamA domain-containing protein n=1 Tax=Marinobacterium nitratireducens TaxID=518897 RepID=A0A918DXX6_9GAMM|nr:DMT family transporter [Marinobacterium nitratireducens]GGO89276.1 hypothetical protein GCM10011348_46650 [Marinobacterium nitratireducens]